MSNKPFSQQSILKKDMFGKEIVEGHIVAVRYAWNSHVGIIRYIDSGFKLLFGEISQKHIGFARYHNIVTNGTYQILGHIDENHIDFNKNLVEWLKNDTNGQCPVNLKIYQ